MPMITEDYTINILANPTETRPGVAQVICWENRWEVKVEFEAGTTMQMVIEKAREQGGDSGK